MNRLSGCERPVNRQCGQRSVLRNERRDRAPETAAIEARARQGVGKRITASVIYRPVGTRCFNSSNQAERPN